MSMYTDAQKKQLLDLIAKWKVRLRLQHWTIRVDWDEPADEGCGLDIGCPVDRHLAWIRVGQFFSEDVTDTERENMVCHELIHLVLAPIYDVGYRVSEQLSPQAATIYRREFGSAHEWTTDALANAFVPLD